jgi:hypothetical protein
MLRKVGALLFIACGLGAAMPATAADLPDIVAGPANAVPQCVTPGRLMAFLKQRNANLDPRYDAIATEYMRHGEQLGLRWDYAFYQMVVETGALSYWRGNRAGDVKPEQNNFAGLGATGNGERGESFKDIVSGVRAHLEHLLLYAGYAVDNPIAERTRKVRDWGVLVPWQQSFKRPITYADLATKWAPGNRGYSRMLQTVADQFRSEVCSRPDPRPSLVQEARAKGPGSAKAADAQSAGAEAQRAADAAKAAGSANRSGLGAQPPADPPPSFAPYKILNTPPPAPQPDAAGQGAAVAKAAPAEVKAPLTTGGTGKVEAKVAAPKAGADKAGTDKAGTDKAGTRTAMAGMAGGLKAKRPLDTAVPPQASQKCRVWTASYGGQKAVIIRSVVDQVVNFTVLDVNESTEAREVEAFISAYAKNGRVAGEYSNQAQALDKAFELCPEG